MKRTLRASLALCMIVLMLVATACTTTEPNATPNNNTDNAAMQYITKEDLKAAIEGGNNEYIVLDVRKAADYAELHINGAYCADVDPAINGDDATATANLKNALAEATGSETGAEGAKYVLVCYSGKKYAENATRLLKDMGIDGANIYTLEGGQKGWVEAGDEYAALMQNGTTANTDTENNGAENTLANKVISVDEMKELVMGNTVKVFDLRAADVYAEGRIPGAMNISNKQFENPDNPVDGELATVEQFEALMSSYGVTSDDLIVVYSSAAKPQMAPRLIWTLEVYGHTNTLLLDGHYEAWVAAGNAIETGFVAAPQAAEYKVKAEDDHSINVDKDYVINKAEGTILLDVRPTAEYLGEKVADGNARGGHIPGAVNVPYMSTVDENGLFLDEEALLDLYAAAGVTADKEIIVYCQRGHRASHTWFVLTHILGFENVKIYDGSMMEWSNLMDQPISVENETASVEPGTADGGSESTCD